MWHVEGMEARETITCRHFRWSIYKAAEQKLRMD